MLIVVDKKVNEVLQGGTRYNTYTTPTFIFTPFEKIINQIEEVESSIRAALVTGNTELLEKKTLELKELQKELKHKMRRVRRQALYGG